MTYLSECTDEEIFNEMRRRFSGRFCCWEDEDIREKLAEYGYQTTKENVEKVWGRAADDWLLDNMISAGYEAIEDAIDWVSEDLTKAEEE